MRAEHLGDGTIAVSGTFRIERFARIWAGIGWPELKAGYLCVLGERGDGRYHALWEKRGGLWELGDEILQAKDRFLIECIWIDARDSVAASYVRTLEGLCFYENAGDHSDDCIVSTPELWTEFKNRTMTAVVSPVPARTLNHYRSALEKVRGLILKGQLIVHEKNCPVLVYSLRQPLDELLTSPVMRALVWVLTALEESKGTQQQQEDGEPWYGNLRRQ